jgi:hypothetical protein
MFAVCETFKTFCCTLGSRSCHVNLLFSSKRSPEIGFQWHSFAAFVAVSFFGGVNLAASITCRIPQRNGSIPPSETD